MILHISMDARDPWRVASALAEVWRGKVYKANRAKLFDLLPPDFVSQYWQAMQPESIQKMIGKPIMSVSV